LLFAWLVQPYISGENEDFKETIMKLEMRSHDLDVNVLIEDEECDNHLDVLEAVQKLIDSLLYCKNVSINISSVSHDDDQLAEDELPDADPQ
jgi:hypothetical protein